MAKDFGVVFPDEGGRQLPSISAHLEVLGEDLLIIVRGGKEHIGTAVLSEPRPSLTGDGSMSCTSSVLNVTGHKDEEICRVIAEQVAAKTGRRTLCTGGVHIDHITKKELRSISWAAETLAWHIIDEVVSGDQAF